MDLQLIQRGFDLSKRRKKWLLLMAAVGFTSYGCYKIYHFPSIARRRRRLFKLFETLILVSEAVSDSAETIGVVSKDLKEFLRSDSDQIPTSLKQISKISRSREFTESLIKVTEALTVGVLRGYSSEKKRNEESETNSGFTDRVLDKLFSPVGSGFASVVVGSFARSLVMGFYSEYRSNGGGSHQNDRMSISNLESDSQSTPNWLNLVFSDKCRELIADSIQLFVSTAVAVYLDKTMEINTYDELFSGLTNPKHESKVKDVLVSVCNGAVETLVKTSHQVLTNSDLNSSTYAVDQREGCSSSDKDEVFEKDDLCEEHKVRSSIDEKKESGWVNKVSSTLAVPGNRRFVLDVTGRVTFETVRSFLEFVFWKLLDGLKRGILVVYGETIERGLEVVRYIGAKSVVISAMCLAFCLHVFGSTRVLMPA